MKKIILVGGIILVVVVVALLAIFLPRGCKKEERAEMARAPAEGIYADFVLVDAKPVVQDNDVLDIETYIKMNWDKALEKLGIYEREGHDLSLTLVLTKMEFDDAGGQRVQEIDFERGSLARVKQGAFENDTNPQIFNRIRFYRGGFSDNYDKPSVRLEDDTAIVHFPLYEELGHRVGTLKVFGHVEALSHYELKKGKAGIYEKVGPKKYDGGLLCALPIDATGVEPVPVYSKRVAVAAAPEAEEKYIETVEVLADALRLRATPDMTAGTVKVLKRGTELKVIEKSGDWYKVRTPQGELGWAKAVHEGDVLLD